MNIDTSISKQFIRSGTSIGANIEEGIGGSSKRDFINKFTIAYKEARESNYWTRLLRKTNYMDKSTFDLLNGQSTELLKMLYVIIKNTRRNLENE